MNMKMIKARLAAWWRGEEDLTEELYGSPRPEEAPAVPDTPLPRLHSTFVIAHTELRAFRWLYAVLSAVFCLIIIGTMLYAVTYMPPYGSADTPTINEVFDRYVEQGMAETGAVNTVAGMILDYRAFDTLGESFVLFTATCTVIILMKDDPDLKKKKHPYFVDYRYDPIVHSIGSLLIPVLLVFGAYILFNGHLSPGGGFSGGAVIGSALMLYAMIFGEERATRVISERVIQTVVLCALGFYALSKSYSFFTGANHLTSIIGPGTPGNIFSAGLILPLNVAVGCVVACTMYTFYILFKRGRLS